MDWHLDITWVDLMTKVFPYIWHNRKLDHSHKDKISFGLCQACDISLHTYVQLRRWELRFEMRTLSFVNVLERMKFFRKPLLKARDRFFSQIQLYDPSTEFGWNIGRFESDVLQEGFIRVQSRGFKRITNPRNWKEMYAVLEKSRLLLFDKKYDETPKFIICLDETVGIFRENVQCRGDCHCIRLSGKYMNCSMCAENEEDRDSWMTMMLTVITEKVLSRQSMRCSMYF